MLFNKGPRFVAEKAASDKPSDPASSTSSTTARPSRNPKPKSVTSKHSADDRYAALLKRIEDLECVHADDKKQHQAEVDRQKSEITRLTKTNAEQSEKLDKLKKQNEAYELRVQELKKDSSNDQTEIKELRAKLRMGEHERNQLANKQAETSDAKKALSSLEAKRREDLKERDRRVAELEKMVETEKKKREMLESCLNDVKKKADEEAAKLRADAKNLQQQLDDAHRDGQEARKAASASRDEVEDREEAFLLQLEQCKLALGRVAHEYAHLASTTVSAKVHSSLKEAYFVLQSRSLRLERKLANSEDQVTELAHLIRRVEQDNLFLSKQLRDSEEELSVYARLLYANSLENTHGRDDDTSSLETEVAAIGLDIARGHTLENLLDYYTAAHDFYRGQADDMLSRIDVLESTAQQERSANRTLAEEVASHTALREASSAELQRLQKELTDAQRSLADEQVSLAAARQSQGALQDKVSRLEKRLSEQVVQHKDALQKERDVAQKLSSQLRMGKTAEETLQVEVDQLHAELAEATRFQDAYYELLGETEELLARNNLAEEEAGRLSRFNAEILGHHNPAQKIVYVDRIRKELSDTKQKLLVCTRDRDGLAATNEDLHRELDIYRSSAVPAESKPRSLFIRVSRPPLTNQSVNMDGAKGDNPRSLSPTKHMISEHLPGPDDMTMDELL